MDYMKGYNSRNRRRRTSRNRVSRPKNDIINSSYYRNRAGQSRTRLNIKRIVVAGIAAVVILTTVMGGVVFLLGRESSGQPGGQQGPSAKVVSGPSTAAEERTASATMDPQGMAADIASVPTLAPEVVATPAPTPRPKAVALTFDDGPRTDRERTPKVLNILKKYDAHATFFVVGQYVSSAVDVLKQEVAQGCEIANHSWDHTNMTTLSMNGVNKQYDKTAKLVKKLVGYDIKLLRPPYGAISQQMRNSLKHPMILWNVDTLDWKTKNPKAIFKKVKKEVKDGDIILMHDIHPTTAESLEKVISWLQDNGYDVLTVSELAKRKGAEMSNGKAYGGFY